MQSHEDKFLKIFVEAIHAKNFDLTQNIGVLNTIIKTNKKDFPQNNMDLENNVFSLINPNRRYQCTIDPNRVIIDYDEPSEINVFKNLFLNTYKYVSSELKIETLNRIGIRSLYGVACNSILDAGDIIKGLFLKAESVDINSLTSNCAEFHCGFNTEYGKYKANFNFAPAGYQNVEVSNNAIKNASVKGYILIDIDFFIQENINNENISVFLKDGIDYIEKYTRLFSKLFKGE